MEIAPNGTKEDIKLGILHSVNGYWVSNEGTKQSPSFHVWIPGVTHASCDSAYADISLAVCRCNYLSKNQIIIKSISSLKTINQMALVEIKITIDPTVESQLIAALNLLRAVGGSSYSTSDQKTLPFEEKESETEEKKETVWVKSQELAEKPEPKKRKSRAKKVEPETPEESEAESTETEESVSDTAEEVKIEDVRAALALKVNDHRPEIKDMLAVLGAKNISSLEVTKYGGFIDFLKSL